MVAAPIWASPRRYDESMTAAVEQQQASASPHSVGGAQAAAQPDSLNFLDPRERLRSHRGYGGLRAFALHEEEVG
jgi:hypothetical protein